jgi:hypothetical protein
MKTLIFFVAFFSLSAMAADNVTKFLCTTTQVIEGKEPTQIQFMVENLDQEKASYFTEDPNEEPVKMIPEDSTLDLNDNWNFEQKADRIHMTSDGDGCQWTDFVLFKNTGYKRGYVSVKDTGCGANPAYSTVTCDIN